MDEGLYWDLGLIVCDWDGCCFWRFGLGGGDNSFKVFCIIWRVVLNFFWDVGLVFFGKRWWDICFGSFFSLLLSGFLVLMGSIVIILVNLWVFLLGCVFMVNVIYWVYLWRVKLGIVGLYLGVEGVKWYLNLSWLYSLDNLIWMFWFWFWNIFVFWLVLYSSWKMDLIYWGMKLFYIWCCVGSRKLLFFEELLLMFFVV